MGKRKDLASPSTGETDWRVESDLNTLLEAERIEADPKRMAKVQALAKEKLLTLASVASEGKTGS